MKILQSDELIDTDTDTDTDTGPILLFTGPFSFLSNFYTDPHHPLTYNGYEFLSAERAYQAQKAWGADDFTKIQHAATSYHAWKYGHELENPACTPVEWDNVRLDVMEGVLWAKFQDAELAELLAGTGDRELVEGTLGSDRFWAEQIVPANNNDGYMRTGRGENWLGRLLMALREGLKS